MIAKERIQKICKNALVFGQDVALVKAISHHEIHPVMAAFGIWNNEDSEKLMAEISANRETLVSRKIQTIASQYSSIVNQKS